MDTCVIPARGGSKRIPRKNIRDFLGRPIIAWSIETALESGCFEQVVVSTDDAEIAEIARSFGALVPFMREAELSNDYAPTVPVVRDCLKRLNVPHDSAVCCLYPTAPFVTPHLLQDGKRRLLAEAGSTFVVSVTTFPHPIERALVLTEAGHIEMKEGRNNLVRSQDLQEHFHDAGQFYWAMCRTWTNEKANVFGPGAKGIQVPRHRVQDIDTQEDWVRAEYLMSAILKSESVGPNQA